ncbi:hypothetical protein ACVGW3_09530 [Enterobacter hormaechei]
MRGADSGVIPVLRTSPGGGYPLPGLRDTYALQAFPRWAKIYSGESLVISSRDFVKIGVPFTVLVMLVCVVLIPVLFTF